MLRLGLISPALFGLTLGTIKLLERSGIYLFGPCAGIPTVIGYFLLIVFSIAGVVFTVMGAFDWLVLRIRRTT